MFTITARDPHSKARVGTLTVPSGATIETPTYVIVGTNAEVRTLSAQDLKDTHTGIIIANTYHLWRKLGEKLSSYSGLHIAMDYQGITMTDSGGFQVFSLGFSREHEVSKVGFFPEHDTHPTFLNDLILQIKIWLGITHKRNSVRVMPWGAYFKDENYGDTKKVFLNARKSIEIQEKLGADIILAFDECTSPKHGYWYTKWAMNRTHRWARKCIEVKKKNDQLLYGIVQGGAFEDLRKQSAKTIGNMPFNGFAIGGSLGASKKDMYNVLEWTMPFLPDEKPRHLLGIGQIRDIFEGVERGIDTFDCVIPTREARHGALWTHNGRFDVKKGEFKDSNIPIEEGCECPTCSNKVTRGMLYGMFHSKNPEGGKYATLHNVFFFNALMSEIRNSIKNGTFSDFKHKTLQRIV
ncbi:MAG: tRNA guanosine(34) transglycosylase Tgt [Candidatus Paceibacterota bacterium]|jgi:queuine tRNA-ribosyltransferase/7-cyano-7-deazaguanine tRNA-ribosyltransferase